MAKKPDMGKLAGDLKKVKEERRAITTHTATVGEVNPRRGEGKRSDFRKVTITLPLGLIEALDLVAAQRRREGNPNRALSEMVREALALWLTDLQKPQK